MNSDIKDLHAANDSVNENCLTQFGRTSRWISKEEGEILHNIVKISTAKSIFESGTAYGFSSACLVSGKEGIHLHTFDLVDKPKIWDYPPLKVEKYKNRIHCHIAPFDEGIGQYLQERDGPSVFFIDGDHSRIGVTKDWRSIEHYLKEEDIVIFHDLHIRPVVKAWLKIVDKLPDGCHTIVYETLNNIGITFYKILKEEDQNG